MNKNFKQEDTWCFKRWSRKPWAAFAGQCRFKIGRLGVGMSIILLAAPVLHAQVVGSDPSGDALRDTVLMEDVVVMGSAQSGASRLHQSVSQTQTIVGQRAAAPVQTTESVLRLLPSVDVRERAGKSPQADISIRGGAFDQTMVMLNGIDFSDPRTGHQSHQLPVDVDIVSGIGIVDWVPRPGALAGGVNFETAIPDRNFLRFRAEGGAHGYGYGNLSGAWKFPSLRRRGGREADGVVANPVSILAAASHKRSDGYRHNTDFANTNAYLRATWRDFDFQAGYQQRDWGSNGFYSLRYPDQFEHTETGLASLRWEHGFRRDWTLDASAAWRGNRDRFEMQRGDPSAIPFNRHTTHTLQADVTAKKHWRRAGEVSGGASFVADAMNSSSMGDRDRNAANAWIGYAKNISSGRRGRLFFEGTGSVTDTRYGTNGTFLGRAVYARNRVQLTLDAARSMRLPTFTDLFYNVATYHPDPNLKPEQAISWRLSARATPAGGWDLNGGVWYRRTKNVIDWEQREDGDWYSTQLNRLGTFGVEASGSFVSDGFLRVAMLGYGYTNSDMTVRAGYISKYALDYLRHKASAVVGFGFSRTLSLTLAGSFYDRVGNYVAADGSVRGYRPYFLLDGRLSWTHRAVQLYLDVTNITGTRYFDFGGLPMPGQWLSAGLAITL